MQQVLYAYIYRKNIRRETYVREKLEADGYETILVDNGDAIQGKPLGMLTKGEAIIDLMNAMKYDKECESRRQGDRSLQPGKDQDKPIGWKRGSYG